MFLTCNTEQIKEVDLTHFWVYFDQSAIETTLSESAEEPPTHLQTNYPFETLLPLSILISSVLSALSVSKNRERTRKKKRKRCKALTLSSL